MFIYYIQISTVFKIKCDYITSGVPHGFLYLWLVFGLVSDTLLYGSTIKAVLALDLTILNKFTMTLGKFPMG